LLPELDPLFFFFSPRKVCLVYVADFPHKTKLKSGVPLVQFFQFARLFFCSLFSFLFGKDLFLRRFFQFLNLPFFFSFLFVPQHPWVSFSFFPGFKFFSADGRASRLFVNSNFFSGLFVRTYTWTIFFFLVSPSGTSS